MEIMISNKHVKLFCKDFTQIENYNLAISDTTQIWNCHHRKEIDEQKSIKQLKQEGLYYNRPPEELIFLTKSEHRKLHGLNWTNEWKIKQIKTHIGKHHSEETRRKMSETMTGKLKTKEHRMKLSEARKRYWQIKKGILSE